MSKEKNKDEFDFKKPKKQLLKYFFIGFLMSVLVLLLLSGIFVLTLITVLR